MTRMAETTVFKT